MEIERGRSKKRKKTRSASSSSSSSTSSSEKRKHKKKKKKHHKKKQSKEKKKHRHRSTSSSSSRERKKKKKEKSKKKKRENELVTDKKSHKKLCDAVVTIMEPQPCGTSVTKRSMVPMTKEEYERQQCIVRRVYDPETGRNRLVKGDGEILEEIVSYARHKEINKISTKKDGESFAASIGLNR